MYMVWYYIMMIYDDVFTVIVFVWCYLYQHVATVLCRPFSGVFCILWPKPRSWRSSCHPSQNPSQNPAPHNAPDNRQGTGWDEAIWPQMFFDQSCLYSVPTEWACKSCRISWHEWKRVSIALLCPCTLVKPCFWALQIFTLLFTAMLQFCFMTASFYTQSILTGL